MPRQRLAPGDHGRITEWSRGGTYFASTYVRDADGKRRRVERSSAKSAEDARRILQRHLSVRRAPLSGQLLTERTTLAELFELWIESKGIVDGVSDQTVTQYRQVWAKHGADQLGALRVAELGTGRANARLQEMGATTQAKRLQMILAGMYGMVVRHEVLSVNPLRETQTVKTTRKAARAATPAEFERVRTAVRSYVERTGPGPRRGRLLPAFVDLLAATGARPNEVLALRWTDVDLLADPPTVTIAGTLVDHGRIAGRPLHRQDERKGGAPPHTVVLPRFGVEVLTGLVAESGMDGPVFTSREGTWVSLANMRRTLRAALPEDLAWITPHSFRRTVASVVRDAMGPALAQQQLSHAKLATTEAHYLQRQTRGPDVRAVLDKFAGQESGD
ncbi:tyrosine-type recombinase/integrase [Mycobacterium gordonae]|uniref:Integrase n=1 Tax=Mycobacterium gordonae TaxID=1778 RepID=A0A1X1W1M4_MYCGO|nr:tyrosine-type recombinase/integrase [Mycobacterium gordonae]MCV7007910.1 tyrosine-type recombinase/integrase [Mycobacterium gordonae]ODR20274.1 integrase [Mycobacterium gordonae]ORV79980.1 integrase [Mycobacterium gordonae]PJE23234.1 MAG: integrase [Mycobacterium sp.]